MSGPAGRAKELEDQILARLLAQLDQGQEPDIDAVRREFAESPEAVVAMVRVLARFRDLLQALRSGDHPPLLVAGEHLDDFEIESFLARGAVGEVYRARQLSLGRRPVALKVVRARDGSPPALARFQREAELAARIHHPHLVEVYGCGRSAERGLLFYAMRLVEGRTLRGVLESTRTGTAPEAGVTRAWVQRIAEIASALARLHREGLVHRDVKPSNIMLEGGALHDGPAVLVDYGLLRSLEEGATRSSLHLTVPYAAPEQLLGKPADPRSDVFGLGAVLHDVLSGRLPEERSNAAEGLEALRTIAPWVDADLEAVVRKAVELVPEWRYADAAELERDLTAWLAGGTVAARTPGFLSRVTRWASSHPGHALRVLAWAGGALVVVGILLLAIVFGAQGLAAARRTNAAWQAGDLAALSRELEALPFLGRSLLDGELERDLDRLRASDGPLGMVAALAASAPERAALLAATHLQREGLRRHPEVARYLVRELRARPDATVALVARLFFERPDGSPEDVLASSSFRRELLAQLASAEVASARYALTALAGCSTPVEAGRLATWARERVQQRGEAAAEELRLVACLLAEVLYWRAASCGFQAAIPGVLLDAVLEECSRAVAQLGPAAQGDVARATLELHWVLELARRSLGLEPGTRVPTWGVPAPVELRALRHDPALRIELLAGLDAFLERGWVRDPFEFGRLVGYYSDPLLASELEPSVERGHADAGLALYSAGLERASEDLRASGAHRLPDADTLLGAALDARHRPWGEVAGLRNHPAPPPRVVALDFEEVPTRLEGQRIDLWTRCVSFEDQELAPGRGFARLGVAGVSALRLDFDCAPDTKLEALEVFAQKGNRWMLPMLGTARLDVLCNGELLAENLAVLSGTRERLRIPLRHPASTATGRCRLEFRLSARSDTTLRIHRIEVLAHEPERPGATEEGR